MINETTAAEVWRILRDAAGASSAAGEQESFILYATGRDSIPEYRFQGALGFGGKVCFRDGKWSVYYYPEDRTDERETVCKRANTALANLTNPEPLVRQRDAAAIARLDSILDWSGGSTGNAKGTANKITAAIESMPEWKGGE